MRRENFLERFSNAAHLSANLLDGGRVSLEQLRQRQQARDQLVDGLMLVVHGDQSVTDALVAKGIETRAQRVLFIGPIALVRRR